MKLDYGECIRLTAFQIKDEQDTDLHMLICICMCKIRQCSLYIYIYFKKYNTSQPGGENCGQVICEPAEPAVQVLTQDR